MRERLVQVTELELRTAPFGVESRGKLRPRTEAILGCKAAVARVILEGLPMSLFFTGTMSFDGGLR